MKNMSSGAAKKGTVVGTARVFTKDRGRYGRRISSAFIVARSICAVAKVYEQSRDQLALFAPKKDGQEALYRRLKSGNKEKWQTEAERSHSEMAALQKRLAALYEKTRPDSGSNAHLITG